MRAPGREARAADVVVARTVLVICELLGVRDTDRERFGGSSNTLIDVHTDRDEQAAGAALGGYLTDLVEIKRQTPDGALLSALVDVSESDDGLSARRW